MKHLITALLFFLAVPVVHSQPPVIMTEGDIKMVSPWPNPPLSEGTYFPMKIQDTLIKGVLVDWGFYNDIYEPGIYRYHLVIQTNQGIIHTVSEETFPEKDRTAAPVGGSYEIGLLSIQHGKTLLRVARPICKPASFLRDGGFFIGEEWPWYTAPHETGNPR